MPKNGLNVALKGADEIFSTEESRQAEQREQVQQIPIAELFPFKDHPFRVQDDEEMNNAVQSISQYGVLTPLIARPRPEGGYEIISGHRRQHAAQLAGLETVPVIVRDMSDDAATILMVDSNLQRENILPSERAFAYKMKLEAMKHQGARSDLTSTHDVSKLRSNEKLGAENNQSRETVRRFIRLTYLVPQLLDMVDQKQISLNPAVELSYLNEEQQKAFIEAMDATQNAPSFSQAKKLRKLAEEGHLSSDSAYVIRRQFWISPSAPLFWQSCMSWRRPSPTCPTRCVTKKRSAAYGAQCACHPGTACRFAAPVRHHHPDSGCVVCGRCYL